MKIKALAFAAIILAMTACHKRVNPFFAEWDTPYGIPPFETIRPADYLPALRAGIEQQNAEIDAITANPDTPTFENTIVPLELSGKILSKVVGVFYNVTETDRTDELAAVEEELIPLMSEHENNISFNKALYNRIAAVYNGDQSGLTREQQMVLKKRYEAFEREGITCPRSSRRACARSMPTWPPRRRRSATTSSPSPMISWTSSASAWPPIPTR